MTAAIITKPLEMPDLLGTAPSDLLPDSAKRHDSTPAEAQERAARLRAGIVRYAEMRQDIADAFACRDWIALGYESWYVYVEGEFGEQLARLDRGERREAVADLREQGMSTRQIASATGIAQTQVVRDLKQVNTNGSPATVTGSDGKQHPASRPTPKPTPTPGPVAAPSTASAGQGPTSEPETKPNLRVVPEPTTEAAQELRADMARESERRAASAGLRSVLTYLTSTAIRPAELAEHYAIALADFTAEQLRFAAETMAAIAALKEQ